MHEYPRHKILARNPEKRPERELLAKQRYIKIYFIIFCIPIYLNMYKITHMLQGKFRGYEIKLFLKTLLTFQAANIIKIF